MLTSTQIGNVGAVGGRRAAEQAGKTSATLIKVDALCKKEFDSRFQVKEQNLTARTVVVVLKGMQTGLLDRFGLCAMMTGGQGRGMCGGWA
eukprot:764760-Hanusia_phi.AAC.3